MTVSAFDFDPNVGNGLRGWDLDRSCTCPGPPSCKAAKPQCDDEAGRDNVGGLQLKAFSQVADAFNPAELNARLAQGLYGLLVRVRGWNGAANDTSVEAALYVSKGTETVGDSGVRVVPKFDGTDVFSVATSSLLGGVAPPYIPLPDAIDTAAYVKDGVLVANNANVRFEFSTSATGDNALVLNLTGVILTGTLTKAKGGYGLINGTLAGRWAIRRMLVALAPLYDPIGGGFLCGDASTYQTIKSFVCGSVDITELPQNDNTNAKCDALSIGLGFTAVPVTFGAVQAGTQLAEPCGPQWVDDCPP